MPVSVKAVISLNGQIPLLRNERNEWELPGGKLDLGESPTVCVQREVHEELNIDISVGMNVHNWVYTIFRIITFLWSHILRKRSRAQRRTLVMNIKSWRLFLRIGSMASTCPRDIRLPLVGLWSLVCSSKNSVCAPTCMRDVSVCVDEFVDAISLFEDEGADF
ncbi:NUDIX domain-containing protein [Candidatus Saccharibacteria bacterium oral taxon 488]|nr:NUDIX hydrolase [Candidatus Saccharibacteria bacterium oral taxon 488]QHU90635.1 NUDIX domain-containing protein [Candidatus Saccharibacteria bacterium oral taxon 488]QJU11202.1 NUDIX hydrolase [Candidatus Saccharibacteria bacterium oral taxon 488]QLF52090.1 NUDIX hydrolase [Candidatus Saccharibacteria bacterium oral taxon 488]